MTERRGQSPFNDANLLAALACYPVDDDSYSRADGLALEEYHAFYRLNFVDAQSAMGIVGVDGERIAVFEGAATDDVVVTAAHYRNIAT